MAVFPVEGGPSSRGSSSLAPAHNKPRPGPGPRSGFHYGYSVYQAEYSLNLLFRSGEQMEDLFNRVLGPAGQAAPVNLHAQHFRVLGEPVHQQVGSMRTRYEDVYNRLPRRTTSVRGARQLTHGPRQTLGFSYPLTG